MGLLEEARKNPVVDDLYQKINAQTPISFQEGPDGRLWSCETIAGRTSINGAPTKHPDAALAHELLHTEIKIRVNGYRQYVGTVSVNENRWWLGDFVTNLDNELQHHRIYQDFLAMGFAREQFYSDRDVRAFDDVRNKIKKVRAGGPAENYLNQFLTLIAPPGAATDDARQKVENLLKARCGASTWKVLVDIRQIIADWAVQQGLDAADTIIRILQRLGGYDRTWIGLDVNIFPVDGKFVGSPFDRAQLEIWARDIK